MYKFMNTLPYFKLLFKVFTLVNLLESQSNISILLFQYFAFLVFQFQMTLGSWNYRETKRLLYFQCEILIFRNRVQLIIVFLGPQKILGLNFNCQCFRIGEDNKRAQDLIQILNCRELLQQSRKLGESQKESVKGISQLLVSPIDVNTTVPTL